MRQAEVDILMVTYNRPRYTRLALTRLLETCDEQMRVWIWHNGEDSETLAVVNQLAKHPRVAKFHHSVENKKLREPTNWLWSNSAGEFISKVDDDCLMPRGWADKLRAAHHEEPEFGVLGCWRFPEEDFNEMAAHRKIQSFGRHRIMRNCWVEGSGYLMKRRCIEQCGVLGARDTFFSHCVRLASCGWINGWYFPFLYQEHMDDPRSPNSLLRSDSDLKQFMPLSAQRNGSLTLAQWQAQLQRSARVLQQATYDPRHYTGWRRTLKNANARVKRMFGVKQLW